MDVEVAAGDADPTRGGFPARVFMLLRMLSQFAHVRTLLTTWPDHTEIRDVEYAFEPTREGLLDKVGRLGNYFATRAPRRPPWPVPDLLFVESLDFMAYARRLPGVPLVLDEHNIYWNFLQYEIVNSPLFKTTLGRQEVVRTAFVPWLRSRARKFELRAIDRAAAVLVTSELERREILSAAPGAGLKVHVVPNCVDVHAISPRSEETHSPTVLFMGNFNYIPNLEAAKVIADELALRLPEVEFLLVGSDPPKNLARRENLKILGYVNEIDPVLRRATVCIAPLRHGSGTRIKILTYLAAGKAVVATTKACEGIDVASEVHLLIRDEWRAFGDAIRWLLVDGDLRSSLGKAGRHLVETKYDWRAQIAGLQSIVEMLAR